MEEKKQNFKSGFVSLIGRPSSGKSSLINAICGYKVSIVSNHPQTTQSVIKGIYNDENTQIVFLDTPGYHNFNSFLNKGLSTLAKNTLEDGDVIMYVVDVTREFGEEEEEIINILKKIKKPIIVVFNKIDKKDKNSENKIHLIKNKVNASSYIETSALQGYNINELINVLKSFLKEGPRYYDKEMITDQSIPFRIKEIVRENICKFTKNEIPHAVYVIIDDLKVTDSVITAHASIFVEKEGQKTILIGKEGKMIKKIGENARIELEEIFERKVNLFLVVKVHHNWRKDKEFLKKIYQIKDF